MFITLTSVCPFCGKESNVIVREEDYRAWENGAMCQDAFPYLSASDREVLISGMCLSCQDKIFGDFTEEEDY